METRMAKMLAEIKARLSAATPDLKNILEVLKEQWPIAEIKVRCTFIDLKSDLSRLLEICSVYEAALKHATTQYGHSERCVGAEENYCERECALLNELDKAIQAANAIAAGEGEE